jgi:integrase
MAKRDYTSENKKRKRASRGTGTLYKRDATGKEHPADWNGGGAFYLAYTIPTKDGGKGKRIRQALKDASGNPITDRTQAEAERRRILAPYQTGSEIETLRAVQSRIADAESRRAEAIEQAAEVVKLSDAWRLFNLHPNRPQCSESTLNQYQAEYKRFAAWMQKEHPETVAMRDITEQHATGYAAELDTAKVSASTFNQHRNFLVMLWRVLRADARLPGNPFEIIERRKLQTLARRKRALEPQEYEAILAAAAGDPDLQDLFIMLAWTGQRLVDVIKMRWQAVDFQRGILTLYPQKTASRTGKAVHPPLFPAAREVLNRRQDPAKVFKLDDLIFPELASEYDKDRGSTLTKRIGKILTSAGLETSATKPGAGRAAVQYGAHSFRHYFVTQAAAAGMPGAMIKQITGHATDDMLEHYQHIGAGFSEELARRIGNGATAAPPEREPVPAWIREIVEGMRAKNWKEAKAEILKGGAA